MNSRNYYLLIFGLALLSVIPLAGCVSLHAVFQDPRYTYEEGAILVGGDDRPIELENNSQAVDVSYAELLEFIREDKTDLQQYVARGSLSGPEPFVCSDFAETLHNNAEIAGIRAGYMTLDFVDGGIGHAINAFQTIDEGMVYIDCTGKSDYSQLENDIDSNPVTGWDKVAYVVVSKKYGVISLDKAQSPLYDYYEQYEQKWQYYKDQLAAYNAEVKQYNLEIAGKVYRKGSPELALIRDWEVRLAGKEKELDSLGQEIGDFRFKPLGIVKSINIHW